MDTRTGEIFDWGDLQEKFKNQPEEAAFFKPIDPTPEQLKRGKVGRNEKCPCGSGLKFKKCCLHVEDK